jgi:hypothetical protein
MTVCMNVFVDLFCTFLFEDDLKMLRKVQRPNVDDYVKHDKRSETFAKSRSRSQLIINQKSFPICHNHTKRMSINLALLKIGQNCSMSRKVFIRIFTYPVDYENKVTSTRGPNLR